MVEGTALREIKTYYKTYSKNTTVWCSCKNSQTNLWNLTKSPEIVPNIYEHLVFDKHTTTKQSKRKSF